MRQLTCNLPKAPIFNESAVRIMKNATKNTNTKVTPETTKKMVLQLQDPPALAKALENTTVKGNLQCSDLQKEFVAKQIACYLNYSGKPVVLTLEYEKDLEETSKKIASIIVTFAEKDEVQGGLQAPVQSQAGTPKK